VPVVWRTRALADVARIARYIATDNPVAAARVARELLIAGDSLALFPRRGRPGSQPGTRELVTIRPYIIVYRIIGPEVIILRVWHAALIGDLPAVGKSDPRPPTVMAVTVGGHLASSTSVSLPPRIIV